MPDPKLYFSWLQLADGSKKYVKDAEAREDIAAIQEILKNGSRYIGKFTSAVVGGETVDVLHQGDVVTSITTSKGTYVTGTPTGTQKQLMEGDYCQYERTGQNAIEWMWNGDNIDEFGSTSMLKALAFKDSASGSFTPAGTNAPSAVTFTGQTDGDFVTGFDTAPALPSFSEGAFNAGSLPTFSEGAFDAGSLPSKEADTFNAGSLPSFTEGTFDAGSLPSMTYDSTNEGIVFAAGSLPSKSADTFGAGSLPSFTEGAFDAGLLPSKAADTFNAGSLPSKAADTFDAGTAPTLATGKAITAVGTGEAAAQTFTGTAGTVTVS